jgi:o-succinylbenzoate synthase
MDVEPFSLRLSDPLRTANRTIDRREGFLVRVERDGHAGIGEAAPLEGWTEPRGDCREALRGATVDDPPDPEATPAAAHAVSLAALDWRTRTAEEPLTAGLGGRRRDRVPVNATVGAGPVDATVSAARSAVDRGFRTLKLKVGAGAVDADLRRVTAVREAVGDAVSIRLDANGAWTLSRARDAFAGLDGLDVEYVEQPLAADRLDEHGDLDGVRVAIDEGALEHGPQAVLAADVADVIVLKPMALGGVERARDVATTATEAGVDPVVTTTVDAVVARTAAVHLTATLPREVACGLATADALADDLAPDPAPVRDGAVSVPEGPGVGVDPLDGGRAGEVP